MKRAFPAGADDDSVFDPAPIVHVDRGAAAGGPYYGARQRPKTIMELLILFRCQQELTRGFYRLNLPHACYLDWGSVDDLDGTGRCFGCHICSRFHHCETDRRTCPVYEVNGEHVCWFSKKPRERVEVVYEPDYGDSETGMKHYRGSLKELYAPALSDKKGKERLLRSANALSYNTQASSKLKKMAQGHGRLMHSQIMTAEYNKQMDAQAASSLTTTTKRAPLTKIHDEKAPEQSAEEVALQALAFRECVYNPDEYKRDNEFYLNYYRAIYAQEEVRLAAARIYARCCPSKQPKTGPIHNEPPPLASKRTLGGGAVPCVVTLRGLYAHEGWPVLADFRRNEFRAMIKVTLEDLMMTTPAHDAKRELSMARTVYYADRIYMLLGLFHPVCLHIWKWGEIVRYVLVCLLGLFRRTVVMRNVILWVADPWLNDLGIELGTVAFRRDYMQKAWLKIGHTFETNVGYFLNDIRDSHIPFPVIQTVVHSTPCSEEEAAKKNRACLVSE